LQCARLRRAHPAAPELQNCPVALSPLHPSADPDAALQQHNHLPGYDVEKPVGPGKAAKFSVPATITGRFEVELHNNATPIAEVTVEP
ncbi:MAG: hypothetical protein ACKOTA_02680, partial [Solirubrobacterales bacterium]